MTTVYKLVKRLGPRCDGYETVTFYSTRKKAVKDAENHSEAWRTVSGQGSKWVGDHTIEAESGWVICRIEEIQTI